LPIIRSADAMLLVARPHDDDLAHVALKLQAAQQWSRRPCFVLVGDGYPAIEVSQALGIPVIGRVPGDLKGAMALCGQGIGRRGPARSKLGHAAATIALNVHRHWHAASKTGEGQTPHLRLAVPSGPVSGAALRPQGPQTHNRATP
jgi:hypothetical protein